MPTHPPTTTIVANASTRSKWRANQCVTIGCKAGGLLVTSRQNRSTPGIYTPVYLKQNTSYRVDVTAQAFRNAKAFVFVYNPATRKRLIPNYTCVSNTQLNTVSADFCTPSCGNEYIGIWLGVLFTGPPCSGQQFCVQKVCVTACAPKAAPCPPSNNNCPPSHCPPNCPPSKCPPAPKLCYHPQPPRAHSYDDCTSSSDDECDETYYHHHVVQQVNTRDPYYTYETQPAHGKARYAKDAYNTCAPPPAACAAPAACPPNPVCPPTQQPVTINDLQCSLNSMISQMKS